MIKLELNPPPKKTPVHNCVPKTQHSWAWLFNGHEVNGIPGVKGKKCHDRAFHSVNKLHDFTRMHDLSGNFCYNDFFLKAHARLYSGIFLDISQDFSSKFKDFCLKTRAKLCKKNWRIYLKTKGNWKTSIFQQIYCPPFVGKYIIQNILTLNPDVRE